jgi:serine phosphatase RsbU (regulator of sigma subunit)
MPASAPALYLITDGITEAMNADNELYGKAA